MYQIEATDKLCPKCGKKTWRLVRFDAGTGDARGPEFLICDDDFTHCGYIEQVGVGPVARR